MDVLLIEDEQKIADFVIAGFAAADITTHHELDGFRGLNTALIKTFDAIVLDVGLPLLDGFQVIQEYRKKEFTTPVIMLTARTDLDDRLKVFQSGADDYMPKPFFVEELIIRIHTLVQRKVGSIEKTIDQSGISLDRFTRVATYQERTVTLTQREFMLLECLMLSPGQIFSRQQILKRSWGIEFDTGTNIVDVCIQRIRKKLSDADPKNLQPFPIESIRGVGYRLNVIK